MQNVALYGYHLVFFAGSKFFNDEAMTGVTGWKLCGESYSIVGQACQFGHFDNIVADTTSGSGIVVDQGANSSPVNNVMFDHVWIGSSFSHGLYLAGVTFSQFDDFHVTRADNGVSIHNSNNVKVSANIAQYNWRDNGGYATGISGGSDNTVWATNTQSSHPIGYNGIFEDGLTHRNLIWGGVAPCTVRLSFDDTGSESSEREPAYAARSCQYEVQGREVRVTFRLDLQGTGSFAGTAMLSGLPFAADTSTEQAVATGAILANAMNGLRGAVVAQPVPGAAAARLFSQGSTGPVALTQRNFTASSRLSGTLVYTKK
jgi:hypothetical protein